MSRTAHRLFSSSLRSSQVNLTTAARSPRAAFTRRMMSSESHASHASAPSDRPWIVRFAQCPWSEIAQRISSSQIGSALVFGPLVSSTYSIRWMCMFFNHVGLLYSCCTLCLRRHAKARMNIRTMNIKATVLQCVTAWLDRLHDDNLITICRSSMRAGMRYVTFIR